MGISTDVKVTTAAAALALAGFYFFNSPDDSPAEETGSPADPIGRVAEVGETPNAPVDNLDLSKHFGYEDRSGFTYEVIDPLSSHLPPLTTNVDRRQRVDPTSENPSGNLPSHRDSHRAGGATMDLPVITPETVTFVDDQLPFQIPIEQIEKGVSITLQMMANDIVVADLPAEQAELVAAGEYLVYKTAEAMHLAANSQEPSLAGIDSVDKFFAMTNEQKEIVARLLLDKADLKYTDPASHYSYKGALGGVLKTLGLDSATPIFVSYVLKHPNSNDLSLNAFLAASGLNLELIFNQTQ